MLLSREIIKRILANVGIMPLSEFGKSGITLPDFKLDTKFFVHYSYEGLESGVDSSIDCPVWAAEGILPGVRVKALCVDLSVDDTHGRYANEYVLVLQVDDNPIYGFKLVYDDEDFGDFLIQDGERWILPTILTQMLALVGMEMLVDRGLSWQPLSSYKELYKAMSHMIEL